MYNALGETETTSLTDDGSVVENDVAWRRWAATETQLRALLGHYILDGQISQYTGFPPCQRHAANTLRLPTAPTLFNAATLEDWVSEMKIDLGRTMDFESALEILFNGRGNLTPALRMHMDTSLCSLTAKVLLEAMKCFTSEIESSKTGISLGAIPRAEISQAMGELYRRLSQSQRTSQTEKTEAIIRWHLIGIDLDLDSRKLCQYLCRKENTQQQLFDLHQGSGSQKIDYIEDWCENSASRRALLHANAIKELIHDLPMSYLGSIHIPWSLFVAAAVHFSFVRAGYMKMSIPETVHWETLMKLDLAGFSQIESAASQEVHPALWHYLHTSTDSTRYVPTGNPVYSSQNLLYNFYDLAKHLRRAATGPWGFSSELIGIVDQWITSCNSRF